MENHLKWLKANKHNLAPLTGQDRRALEAIAASWELLCADRNGRHAAINSVIALLPALQTKCWPLAKELIARTLDWGDRERVWKELEAAVSDLVVLEIADAAFAQTFDDLFTMRTGRAS